MSNKKTKVSVLIKALKESKTRYLMVLTPEDKCAMVIKINVDPEDLVKFLDPFYDSGFKIKKIEKEEFDTYKGDEDINFNL